MRLQFEMIIIAAKKALQKLVDDNPKSGVIVDRGEMSEGRIRYSEALEGMERLNNFFTNRQERAWEYCPHCGKHPREEK